MLSPHEFLVGHLSDVTAGLTLVLPRGQHDIAFLIVASGKSKMAVALEGDHRFLSFDCSGNTSWSGVVIPNIAVEVDETSVSDSAPLGALVRAGTTLAIKAKQDGGMGNQTIPLATSLAPCPDGLTARFTRWRIVMGTALLSAN